MEASWARVKTQLAERVEDREFATWIKPLRVEKVDGDFLSLLAPNPLVQDWFNQHYLALVKELLTGFGSPPISVRVGLVPDRGSPQLNFGASILGPGGTPKEPTKKRVSRTRFVSGLGGLNPRNIFSRFIVGSSNDFAYAASMMTAKKPGRAYNPLFIYGGTGLGKTHLLHGIGHYLLSGKRDIKVVVMSAEGFTNEMITAIQNGQTNAFRKKFRRIDALLVDDIEFLIGKERTQVEFFHTFNELYENGAQVVLTSDRHPKELVEIQERLQSRFNWGLSVDIQPVDLETRIAILKERAKENSRELPDETAYFIANLFPLNIRDLEGAFIRLSAYASFHGTDMNLQVAKKVLELSKGKADRPVSIENIQRAVCNHFRLTMSQLTGKRRQQSFVFPRQVAGYLAREMTGTSFPKIGRRFGGRDHSTIVHAHKKIAGLRAKDSQLNETIEKIEKKIRAS